MNKLIAGAARRNRTYLPTAFQELTSRNWHIISGLRHPACKENFPRSRKLAFLRNVGTERGRTFVLSKPRLRSAICAAFSRRLRKTAKTLNHHLLKAWRDEQHFGRDRVGSKCRGLTVGLGLPALRPPSLVALDQPRSDSRCYVLRGVSLLVVDHECRLHLAGCGHPQPVEALVLPESRANVRHERERPQG
jgi:hypothetical protein